jgi:signal transduction histidine kinase
VSTTVSKVSDEEKAPPTSLVVLCGKDLGEVDDTVSALVALLAWLGPLASALALLGGLFLAGRALRPIDQIARTAAAIGEHDLTHRIPVHGRDELAMLAATLNNTFDRLQRAFDRQVRFTADASHELRTPLAAIVGNLELLLGRPRSPDEMRNLLQEMRTSANQMHDLMEGLLTLARADHGVAGAGDRVCLAPLGEQVLQEMADETREHRVALRLAATAAPDVTGDPDCLRRLLRNLVRNAVRYNRPGGQVVVHVGADAHAAWLEVEDDGIGIPAAALPHLGERFYRVDSSRTRSTGGVGLGLSIVKAIVAAHQGQFEIRSVEGAGTRVKVSFPLAS